MKNKPSVNYWIDRADDDTSFGATVYGVRLLNFQELCDREKSGQPARINKPQKRQPKTTKRKRRVTRKGRK